LDYFKATGKKDYHMFHRWRPVKNAPKWRLGYEAYKMSIKNGRDGAAIALDGEEEAPGNMLFHLGQGPQGHQGRCNASALALSETLKTAMAWKEETIVKMEEKRH
jgi:hypothetical protein